MLSRVVRSPIIWRVSGSSRCQSTALAGDLVTIDVNEKNGISTLRMNHEPVNSMTLNFLKEFSEKMDQLEKNRVKGMILTSGVKNVFAAGLNFDEVINPEPTRFNEFWTSFRQAFNKLHGASFPTAALMNGHAMAGGCVFALSCEYRVMLPNLKTGLNETIVGIVPPYFVIQGAIDVVGPRKAEMMLTTGATYTSEEALKMGIVDELANTEEEAHVKCENFLLKFGEISPLARSLTKFNFRGKALEMSTDLVDAKVFTDYIQKPSTQDDLKSYVSNLKKK